MATKNKPAESAKSSVAALRTGQSPSKGSRNASWENVKAIAGTIAVFLLIRTFLIEAYRIPSGSMIPSLLIGDWLFVNKAVYGPHVPGTDMNLPGFTDPKRGDVVVFKSPPQSDQPDDPTPTLVKRCVALAGDTVQMKAGLLYVNGAPQHQIPAAAQNRKDDGSFSHPLFVWQKAFEIHGSRMGEPPASPTLDDWGPMVVPKDHLFMLGDNRYDSKDGRYWGFVPRENVRGRPVFVYYSYNADDSPRPAPYITDIRWSRIGTIIR